MRYAIGQIFWSIFFYNCFQFRGIKVFFSSERMQSGFLPAPLLSSLIYVMKACEDEGMVECACAKRGDRAEDLRCLENVEGHQEKILEEVPLSFISEPKPFLLLSHSSPLWKREIECYLDKVFIHQ